LEKNIESLSHPALIAKVDALDRKPLMELEKQGYGMLRGIDSFFLRQLIAKSAEPHILNFLWQQNTKETYLLRHNHGNLAGAIWFDSQAHAELAERTPQPNYTFAIRLYNEHTDTSLALHFMEAAHRRFLRQKTEDVDGIWLSLQANDPAQQLHEQFGYEDVTTDKDQAIMVLSPERFKELS
jgi:hypothetical protein